MNTNFSITKNKHFELELSKHTYGYHPWLISSFLGLPEKQTTPGYN